MATIYPNGTPLPTFATDGHETDNTVSVASFNLLAPLYIRPVDQRTGEVQPFASFEWISEEDSDRILGGHVRLPKLLKRMQDCESDFICVQELQLEVVAENDDVVESPSDCGFDVSDCNEHILDGTKKSRFSLPQWITPLTDGYGVILPNPEEMEKMAERNRRVLLADAAITNAIFYKLEKWKPVSQKSDGMSTSRKQSKDSRIPYHNTTNCVLQSFISLEVTISNRNSTGDIGGYEPVAVASIHLDAKSEEKRVQQLQRCLERSIALSDSPFAPPLIIAGDYNCEFFPGSCVHAFLQNDESKQEEKANAANNNSLHIADDNHISGHHSAKLEMQDRIRECSRALRLSRNTLPSKEQLQSWNNLHASVTSFVYEHCWKLDRVKTGCTRVAYDHGDETIDDDLESVDQPTDIPSKNHDKCNSGESSPGKHERRTMLQWHLDHILYTSHSLMPLGKWSTLEDDEYSSERGLPNDRVPTDHLPIAALFKRQPHPRLDGKARVILIESLQKLEERQKNDMQILLTELDRQRAEIDQQQKLNEEASSDRSQTHENIRQRKKKKTGPPPPEIIQHIRTSRSRIKMMKEAQRVERENFVNRKCWLERLELQHFLGATSKQWINIL